MKIILDSNPIFGDFLLNSALFATLEKYISLTDDEVALPEVVLEEIVRQFGEKYTEVHRSYSRLKRISSVIGVELSDPPSGSEAIELYRSKLLERLRDMNIRLLPVPDVDVKKVLKRDLSNRKPFNGAGKGFRDTLIWLTILEECKNHEEKVVLISSDGDFKLNAKESSEPPQLHDDLTDDLVSLGFSDDRVIMRKTILDFNEDFANPTIEHVYQFGDQLEGTFAESLRPVEILEVFGEAAARSIQEDLPFILPIGHGYADEVRFIDWLHEAQLMQALDLGDGIVQAFIRTRIVFDTDIYGSQDVLHRLIEFTKGRGIILQNYSWDENQRNMYIHLRVSLLAEFVVNWDTEAHEGTDFTGLRYGFTKDELNESRLYLY